MENILKKAKTKVLALSVGAFLVTSPAMAEDFIANIFFPATHPLGQFGYVDWAKDLEIASGGKFKPTVYTGTVLLPPRAGMSGVRDGIAQVGYHAGTYTPAELPISNALQELGFNYSDALVMSVAISDFNMNNADALKQWKDAGIIYGGGYSTPPYNLMCSSPMKSLKDLKGKRLRTAGAALSRWAESIGAVPVNVPSSEMYQGVEKGSIDCAVNVASDLKSRSLWDVAKHTTMVPVGLYWSGPMYAYNKDFWKGLSEQDRRVFFNTSAKALGNLYVGYAAAVGTAVSEAAEHGVTIYQPSEDVLASIATFSQDNLQNVYATARDKYKIENPEALIGKFDDRVKKWEKLFADVDRKDAGAIAKIIKAELYDKIDASTYGG